MVNKLRLAVLCELVWENGEEQETRSQRTAGFLSVTGSSSIAHTHWVHAHSLLHNHLCVVTLISEKWNQVIFCTIHHLFESKMSSLVPTSQWPLRHSSAAGWPDNFKQCCCQHFPRAFDHIFSVNYSETQVMQLPLLKITASLEQPARSQFYRNARVATEWAFNVWLKRNFFHLCHESVVKSAGVEQL